MIIPHIIKIAKKLNVIDQADNRKTHIEKVSALGGIGIWSVTLITYLISGHGNIYLLVAISILWSVNLIDDLNGLSARFRLLIQIVVSFLAYLSIGPGFIGGPMGIEALLFVFFSVWLINAYNFIDGINGLAGSLGLLASTALGLSLYYYGDMGGALLALSLAGSLISFLHFNYGVKAQIFMGDNGSAVIGLVLCVLTARLGIVDQTTGPLNPPVIALISIPAFDLLRVIAVRILANVHPMKADREHIHHLLVDNGWIAPTCCTFILGWSILLLIVALLPYAWLTIPLFLIAGFTFVYLLSESNKIRQFFPVK